MSVEEVPSCPRPGEGIAGAPPPGARRPVRARGSRAGTRELQLLAPQPYACHRALERHSPSPLRM